MSCEGSKCVKSKHDLAVTWRGVYFTPSPQNIKAQVKERAKIESQKRIQQEKTLKMYEIFGSGKLKDIVAKGRTSQILQTKLSDKDSDDIDTLLDHDPAHSSIRSRTSAKFPPRKTDSLKIDTTIKRNASINQSVDIRLRAPVQVSPVNYLNTLFIQNRPQHYFGIRKPKCFESAEERDLKDVTRRSSVSNEIVLNFMNKQKTDTEVKDTTKRVSLHRLSLHLPTLSVDELREKFTDMNKALGGNRMKGQDDILDILNKLVKDSVNAKFHLLSLSGYKKVDFPDSDERMGRSRILELYVSKYYRIKHPLRQENAKFVEETPMEAEVMKNCILNNKILSRILTKRSFYSHRFQTRLADIDAGLSANQEENESKQAYKRALRKAKTTLKVSEGSEGIFDEIGKDIREFDSFYLPLLLYSFNAVPNFKEFENETDIDKIKKYVQSLSYALTIHRNHPGSMARQLTQQFIKAGEQNSLVMNELISNAEGWLDQLLKTFLSKFQSIRLEAFVTLAYLFSKPSYVTAIHSHIFNDIMYDVCATILRCFDLRSEDYEIYYSLLGVIFHYAPSQVLLDCLIERAPYSNHIEVVSKWPRFLFYGVKYWSTNSFNSNMIHLKRMIETLETHYMRESLSRKCLKEAITCISKRFNVNSTMFTTWSRHSSHYPD